MADDDGYTIKALSPDTWEAFAELAERYNGVWNGCWCTGFITPSAEKTHTVEGNRALTKRCVEEGTKHAALVSDGERAIGWCEFGSPAELPNIYHRGGIVEAYPLDDAGKKMSASFLYNGTRQMFEDAGFTDERSKGAKNCVMTTSVAPA